MNIVFIVHYFPPVNSSGAKRVEAISKYLAADGHDVTVITTRKTASDGGFTEVYPEGVRVLELDHFGRMCASEESSGAFEPMYTEKPSLKRRIKDVVLNVLGQVPDPRLPFALSFLSPMMNAQVKAVLNRADVVIGSSPPWPLLLAAVICKKRFNVPCILDYRDHFSECHEMPGGRFAKWLELKIDRWLVGNASHLVTISEPMSSYYRTMAPNVDTIMNGYDHEVLDAARLRANPSVPDKVVLRYMGIVSPGRVPHNVMRALVRLKASEPHLFERFQIEYYGGADLIKDALVKHYPSIDSAFSFHAAVPYQESLRLIAESDYLIFAETSSTQTLSAQGILTTKLFEYIGAGRPVLGDISVDTLAGSFLRRADENNVIGVTPDIFFEAFSAADFYQRKANVVSDFAQGLSRRAQAHQYTDVIRQVVAREQ
ncbi:glycosyltransferase involved in cell wall biosynthesis [Pseudomonas putida]|jgi:glycosyltransferase involved in cell wall biosynthesis|uniref:glycosyltransferase n=1 Tax=Pseudomonas putida TaxID=303 RepID=UPI0010429447|nr:glycosyltransferase [Pseudomonas putida]TCP75503.1 glycosyltransferase involved in cell wall biosynthesis [Pseudomonas putida]